MVVVKSSAATATMLVFSAINGLGDAFKKCQCVAVTVCTSCKPPLDELELTVVGVGMSVELEVATALHVLFDSHLSSVRFSLLLPKG